MYDMPAETPPMQAIVQVWLSAGSLNTCCPELFIGLPELPEVIVQLYGFPGGFPDAPLYLEFTLTRQAPPTDTLTTADAGPLGPVALNV